MTDNHGKIKSDRTPFLKLYTDDWIAGTIELDFEEKGFYFEILLRMWERKGSIPNDERWIACALGCNPRSVRKLLGSLVAHGKFKIVGGQIVNNRMMREISTHLERQFKPNSGRIQAEREVSKSNPDPIQPGLDSNSTGTQPKNITKSKTLKTLPEARSQKPEEKKEQASEEQPAEMLAGDLSEQMILDISKWGNMPVAQSRQWLGESVATFGQRPVADSYHEMLTKKNEGMIVSRPLAFWSRLAKDARDKAERGKTTKQAPWIEEKLAGQREALQIADEMGYA